MKRLRMHPGVSVIATRAGVLLRSDVATYQVTGADARAFLERLVPLLDGTRDRAAVVAALGDRSAESVGAILDGLLARGIVEAEGEGAAAERWAGARVLVAGRARWGRVAARELAAAGVKVGDGVSQVAGLEAALAAERPALLVAAVAPEDAATVERLARAAHRAGVASLWAHEAGGSLYLGPLVAPGETACRVCAAEASLDSIMARSTRARREAPLLLGHLVAMEALGIVGGHARSQLGGRVRVEDLASWTSSVHTLLRLPWCRVCGDAR